MEDDVSVIVMACLDDEIRAEDRLARKAAGPDPVS